MNKSLLKQNPDSFGINFFNSCRRCLNPWVITPIIIAVAGLLIFVPIVGVATLIAALPLVGCTVMCGAMAFMMRDHKKDNK